MEGFTAGDTVIHVPTGATFEVVVAVPTCLVVRDKNGWTATLPIEDFRKAEPAAPAPGAEGGG